MPMYSRLFPTFSSISFSVSSFMWRSLIHLELSFVQGDKYRPICILLHADLQWNQPHLLKMQSFFFIEQFYPLCQRSCDHSCIGSFLDLQFYSTDLPACLCTNIIHFFNHYFSVIQLDVRDGDSPRNSFIVENSFLYPGIFAFPNEFANCSF